MKNIIIALTLMMILFGCNKSSDYGTNVIVPPASPHTFTVGGTSFSPNFDSAHVGDTMHFRWSNGSHTTTSVSIPTGAATWSTPLNSSSTSFDYIVTVAGTYNFQCNIHYLMGMTGSFIVR